MPNPLDAVPERYLVVTSDSHVGPRIEEFRPYCPQRFGVLFEEQVEAVSSNRSQEGGFAETAAKVLNYPDLDQKVIDAANRAIAVEGSYDVKARLRDMEREGTAGQVIFHGHHHLEPIPLVGDGVFGVVHREVAPEIEAAGYHMYNQWIADFIAPAPERFAALAYVSLLDIQRAVEEVRWAREAGLRGVNFPAPRRALAPFTDPVYEPFFAACAELEMPLTTHSGGGDRWTYTDGPLSLAFQHIEAPFVARRGVWQLIFSGAFDRHPNLKLVLTEIFAEWVPEVVRDMDAAVLDPMNPEIRRRIKRLPSEYWDDNCFIGASFLSHSEAEMYPADGTRNIMWGDDYPHIEGAHPYHAPRPASKLLRIARRERPGDDRQDRS